MKKKRHFPAVLLLALLLLAGCSWQVSRSDNGNKEAENLPESINVSLKGGSGKVSVSSPAELTETDGSLWATLVFSSKNYDYMIVDGEAYYPLEGEEYSTFRIPIPARDCTISIQADTTAMSQPHLISYQLSFGSYAENEMPEEPETSASISENQTEKSTSSDDGELTLSVTGHMDLTYAEGFSVDHCEGGLELITVGDERFLLIPEGQSVPRNLPDSLTVLKAPLEKIYLVSSAAMDMFASCSGMDALRFCALEEQDWLVDEAKEAMQEGRLQYAGKYSAPDYELLCAEGCDLAIENTMVLHQPEVVEQLERLGIPVMIERSSYESTPEGRMEWIRLFGLLSGHPEEAEAAFEKQISAFASLEEGSASGKTVAFFYVTSAGEVNIRTSNDYIPQIIRRAGGSYAFDALADDSSSATQSVQMEDFYALAKNADIVIYNSTIVGELNSLDDFLQLHPLFQNLKAVKEGNVYCCTQNLYQASMKMGSFALELQKLLNDENPEYSFFYPLN